MYTQTIFLMPISTSTDPFLGISQSALFFMCISPSNWCPERPNSFSKKLYDDLRIDLAIITYTHTIFLTLFPIYKPIFRNLQITLFSCVLSHWFGVRRTQFFSLKNLRNSILSCGTITYTYTIYPSTSHLLISCGNITYTCTILFTPISASTCPCSEIAQIALFFMCISPWVWQSEYSKVFSRKNFMKTFVLILGTITYTHTKISTPTSTSSGPFLGISHIPHFSFILAHVFGTRSTNIFL